MKGIAALVLLVACCAPASAETMQDAVGCQSKDDVTTLVNFAVSKDMASFKTFYAARVDAGQCLRFWGGESVSVLDQTSNWIGPRYTKDQPASAGPSVWVMSKCITP